MPWDNPFPTFNTKKKDQKRRHASLDKGTDKLDLHGRNVDPRPHTSQSHRTREDMRPHTSHGQKAPEDFSSPRIPGQGPMSPLQRDQTDPRQFQGSINPAEEENFSAQPRLPNRQNVDEPKMPSNGYHNHVIPGAFDAPLRSRTMPDMANAGFRRPMTGHATPGPPGPNSPEGAFGHPPAQRTRSHENPLPYYDGPQSRQDYHPTQDAPSGRTNRSQGYTEVPNFDMIPTSANEKPDVHIEADIPQAIEQPAYQKKVYQAPAPFQPQLDHKRTRNPASPPEEIISPLKEFHFDLPQRSQRGFPASGNHTHAGGPPHRQEQSWNTTREWPANGPSAYQHAPQGEPSYLPIRSTSRPNVHTNTVSEDQRHFLPNPPRQQQQRLEYGHPGRLNNTNPGADGWKARSAPPVGRDMAEWPEEEFVDRSFQQDPAVVQRRFGDEYQQGIRQRPPPPSEPLGPRQGPIPGIGNPPRPPPVRYYDKQESLETTQKEYDPISRPDALPAHPTPVRPGLTNNAPPSRSMNAANASQNPSNQEQTASAAQAGLQEAHPSNDSLFTPVTAQELSSLQSAVRNNPTDYALGLQFAKKLVEAASVLANEQGMADQKTTLKNRERYILDAHKQVKRLVNAGYPEAMFYLADCYGQGFLGLAADPKEAFQLYQSAAKLNHAQSAYRVAVCCELGQEEGGGTRRDPLKAMQWYKRAATLGDTPAMYKMGMILLKGLLGQATNPREAISWLKRAAERADAENPHALHELGLLYESAAPNDPVIRDEKHAFQLFKQASELGYKYSQFRLGAAFEHGLLGCSIDPRQSISWYSKAAAQGEHQSELALSGWYLTGSDQILQQSDTEAYLWARKAASSGLAKAEYAMGYYSEVGIGVQPSLEEAKRWYYRAAGKSALFLCGVPD